MNINTLRKAIEVAWNAHTSSADNWSPENPALGQCAVTALVVQDYLGGELLRTTVGDVSHYFNRLPDGTELDLTRQQFAEYVPTAIEPRERDYVLSYPATVARYELLSERVSVMSA